LTFYTIAIMDIDYSSDGHSHVRVSLRQRTKVPPTTVVDKFKQPTSLEKEECHSKTSKPFQLEEEPSVNTSVPPHNSSCRMQVDQVDSTIVNADKRASERRYNTRGTRHLPLTAVAAHLTSSKR
jgi:hypothetical protein